MLQAVCASGVRSDQRWMDLKATVGMIPTRAVRSSSQAKRSTIRPVKSNVTKAMPRLAPLLLIPLCGVMLAGVEPGSVRAFEEHKTVAPLRQMHPYCTPPAAPIQHAPAAEHNAPLGSYGDAPDEGKFTYPG